jgi:hypothetical protein
MDVTLLPDQALAPGFLRPGWRLVPGYAGEAGLPLEAFLRLFAVGGEGGPARIARPEELAPLVDRIRGEEDAWSFLRLFTSPGTFAWFPDVALVEPGIGDPGGPGEVAAILPEAARRLGVQPPRMTRSGQEYRALRDLLRVRPGGPSAPLAVVRLEEALGEDGTYRVVDERRLGTLSPGEAWVPYFE